MAFRRRNEFLQDREVIDFSHDQVTSGKMTEFYAVPAGRTLAIDRVLYVSPAGLPADDAHFAIVKVLSGGSALAASWSTKATGGNGSLVAGTVHVLVLSDDTADIYASAGEKLSLFLDLSGNPTLPPGSLRVEGRLL